MQAITTKYYGPTNTKPARIRAKACAGTNWFSYNHAVSNPHREAAEALRDTLGWEGRLIEGGLPDAITSVFVFAEDSEGVRER